MKPVSRFLRGPIHGSLSTVNLHGLAQDSMTIKNLQSLSVQTGKSPKTPAPTTNSSTSNSQQSKK